MRTRKLMTNLLVIAAVLSGGLALAQGRGRGGFEALPRAGAGDAPMATHAGLLRALHFADLPIGTTVEVAFHEGDPADGAAAVTTLSLTVGVDSEAAFAESLTEAREQAAGWEAPFVVVSTGEQTRTVVLTDDADVTPRLRTRSPLSPWTWRMAEGDTIAVTLYAGDPADGGTELERLAFTYGVDSAIGFRGALQTAREGADTAIVVTGPRSVTLELGAVESRMNELRGRAAGLGASRGAAADDQPRGADPRGLRRPMLPGRTR